MTTGPQLFINVFFLVPTSFGSNLSDMCFTLLDAQTVVQLIVAAKLV